MKYFYALPVILFLAIFAIKMTQTPTASTVRAAQQENMTQFSTDLGKYMEATLAKENDLYRLVRVEADCKPNQGAYHTRCWIEISTSMSDKPEKATAENVRRVGDKFVWDHES